jgi:hypothetical protein
MSRTIGAAVGAVIIVLFFASLAIDQDTTPSAQLHARVSAHR